MENVPKMNFNTVIVRNILRKDESSTVPKNKTDLVTLLYIYIYFITL